MVLVFDMRLDLKSLDIKCPFDFFLLIKWSQFIVIENKITDRNKLNNKGQLARSSWQKEKKQQKTNKIQISN